MDIYYVEIGPSMSTFWRAFVCVCVFCLFFKFLTINGCWIRSNLFPTSVDMTIWFIFFNFLMWCITLIDYKILKKSCIPGKDLNWSCCVILLMNCWLYIIRILLWIFASIYQWYWPVLFYIFGIIVWFWYQNDSDFIKWVWKYLILCSFLE